MLISEWRSGLRAWLNKYILVDSWELRNPTEYNKVNAFLPPLQNIIHNSDQVGSCNANQDIYLTVRYRGDLKYDELPLGDIEQLYSMVAVGLNRGYADIAPLLDFDLLPVPDSVQVQEYGDGLADWLVTLVFTMNISWLATKTPLPGEIVDPRLPLREINAELFTTYVQTPDMSNPLTRSRVGTVKVIAD